MKNLILFCLLFLSISASSHQIEPEEKPKALFTLTVNFNAGECDNPKKAWTKLHNELAAIKANSPNMAVVQITGHSWEGNINGVPLCSCRANRVLQEVNRWSASNNVGQSSGITFCQTHIHSGPENQRVEIIIDAFL